MKLAVLVPVWGRSRTLEVFAKCIPGDVDVYAVASSPEDVQLCQMLNFDVIHAPNNLPEKLQAGLEYVQQFKWDAMIMMGSDDIISEDGYNYLKAVLRLGNADICGFLSCYFYDSVNNKYYYWPGYENHRKGEPVGAGRTYRRSYMEGINYELWTGAKNKYTLDGTSWKKAKKANWMLMHSQKNVWLCDIKDEESLTSIDRIPGLQPTNKDLKLCKYYFSSRPTSAKS